MVDTLNRQSFLNDSKWDVDILPTEKSDEFRAYDAGPLNPNTPIAWGSATRMIKNRPTRYRDLEDRIAPMMSHPKPDDVMVARIREIGRHAGIELDTGRKASLYVGDLLGVAFGWRYATRQFYGEVPPLQNEYHMLSQGGVCGRVISAPDRFAEPTILEPIGYLAEEDGSVLNLRNHGLRPQSADIKCVQTIVVLGSSMDAGKTTLASSLIHGLTLAGKAVHAAKLTGTGCVKDINMMLDSGARTAVDFTWAGHASTARKSREDLESICQTLLSHLTADNPDVLVLEIADGIVQRETRKVIDYLVKQSLLNHVCLAVQDAMAAPACLMFLREQWGLTPTLVSGAATASPLSTEELRSVVPVPCVSANDLLSPHILTMFAST